MVCPETKEHRVHEEMPVFQVKLVYKV